MRQWPISSRENNYYCWEENTLCSSEINNYTPSELLHCGSRLTAVFQCCSVWKQTYCSVPVFQCSEGDYHNVAVF